MKFFRRLVYTTQKFAFLFWFVVSAKLQTCVKSLSIPESVVGNGEGTHVFTFLISAFHIGWQMLHIFSKKNQFLNFFKTFLEENNVFIVKLLIFLAVRWKGNTICCRTWIWSEVAKVGFIPDLANVLKMPENGSKGWSWPKFKCGHVFDLPKAQEWPEMGKNEKTSRPIYGLPGRRKVLGRAEKSFF